MGLPPRRVSRAINRVPHGQPFSSPRRRLRSVVEELGYYPNTQARALVSGRQPHFGLVISEITNPFFPEIVQVFETIAVSDGYEILLTPRERSEADGIFGPPRMIERRVEAWL